jgi:membrane-bound serine protease (ClpP class)
MIRLLLKSALIAVIIATACRAQIEKVPPAPEVSATAESTGKKRVMVIPVRDAIDDPVLFILRRGLKEAIEQKMDAVVLDMDTPGGSLGTMLQMMEALDKFPGQTLTFVNDEAGSAGALIAATTDQIIFEPKAVMGASEPVLGSGQDLSEGMKRKVTSYLNAKVDAYSDSDPRRADVIRAMMDPNFELKIGDQVIKPKGEILTLNAKKALTTYGDPPIPLLEISVAANIDELLATKFGADSFVVKKLEVTWSEELAQYLTSIKPLLMGLGLLAIFIELKTPGFGVFGVAGGLLLGIVFLSSYVAGLSGHEPLIVFALGVALVAIEVFLFPGIVVVALTGVLMILGSLLWAMADLWPNQPISISGDVFVGPAINLMLGLLIAVVLALLFARFMPKGWFFSRLALATPLAGPAQIAGVSPDRGAKISQLLGARGVATTALFPTGQVEVDGRRYEAKVEVGSVAAGTPIVVTRVTDFGLVVEVAS